MSFSFEKEPAAFANRYAAIDAANKESFYLNNPARSFDAFQSIHSFGPARSDSVLASQRVISGGNMSPLGPYGPLELSETERSEDAKANMEDFFASIGVSADTVYMLNPERNYETPLTVVNADEQEVTEDTTWPARLDKSGDFVYSYDSTKVLAARPADCPIMFATADTPEGKIHMLVHYAWKGAASQYVKQTADVFDTLGVDRDTLEIYLTPGGQAESFPYTNYPNNPLEEYPGTESLFANVEAATNDEGKTTYSFGIDTPKYVYEEVLKQFEVDQSQVFCDTSNTSALESGYSSHGRSMRLKDQGESNTRDVVVAVFQ